MWWTLAQIAPVGSDDPRPPMRHWTDGLREGFLHSDVLAIGQMIALLALVGAIVAGLWLWKRHRQNDLLNSPLVLFHEMAQQLGLDLKAQWLLTRIARRESLPTPLTLLLSTQTLAHHAGRYAQALPARRREQVLSQVRTIQSVMFGQPPP